MQRRRGLQKSYSNFFVRERSALRQTEPDLLSRRLLLSLRRHHALPEGSARRRESEVAEDQWYGHFPDAKDYSPGEYDLNQVTAAAFSTE